LVTSPSTAAACIDMTADNFDFDNYQKEAAVPPCCLTADLYLTTRSYFQIALPRKKMSIWSGLKQV
jgi:hypothetical protein